MHALACCKACVEYLPVAQGVHVVLVMAPEAVDHVPGEQLVHARLAKVEAYVPAMQSLQETVP